jgi:hypothetical protein
MTEGRRFPPPWTVDETEPCFIVKDHNGQALAYVIIAKDEPGGGLLRASMIFVWPVSFKRRRG